MPDRTKDHGEPSPAIEVWQRGHAIRERRKRVAFVVQLEENGVYRIPISGLSAIIAIAVASAVGILFGTVPATRAAQLDPVDSLRYE